MSEPGAPTEMSPWLVYERVRSALEIATGMQAAEVLLGNRTSPEPLLHRQFRLEPASLAFTPPSRARPGDSVAMTEEVTVWLSHEVPPGNAKAAYHEATLDFLRAVRALLTRKEVSRLAAPKAGRLIRRQVGGVLEQAFVVSLSYFITLPEAA